jgi:hypothetical protein
MDFHNLFLGMQKTSSCESKTCKNKDERLNEAAEKLRFWVAQCFQRCGKCIVLDSALAAEVAPHRQE